jgi:hypothetical protein
VSGAGGWKYPPAGVPAEPDRDRPYVPLSEAAQRLGVDRRTLLRALTSGATAGWARPGPDNLRWFVYDDAENAELRARLSNASESNLLLIAAQEDLTASAALLSAASDKYRQALSLYMTPDNLAGLMPER